MVAKTAKVDGHIAYLDISTMEINVKCPICKEYKEFSKQYFEQKQRLPMLVPCLKCGIEINVTDIRFRKKRTKVGMRYVFKNRSKLLYTIK